MAFTVTTEAFHEAVALLLQQKESLAVKMYIEYASSPSPPTQSVVQATGDHNAYYTGLSGPDFLRVDVSQYPSVVGSGHYQGTKTLDYTKNKITFTGFTSAGGATGEKGVSISGKKVYGAAIVLSNTKTNTVATDVVVARCYFDASDYITVATSKGASVQVLLNLIDSGACTGFGTGSSTFTGIPANGGTLTLIDNAATPVTKIFEFNDTVTTATGSTINAAVGSGSSTNICVGTSGLTGSLGTATFTFSDKPNEESHITVIDTDGTSVTFEIDDSEDYTGKGVATFTFSDKPNEGSTITIVDSDGTSLVFEIDNEANGVTGSNVAVNGIAAAGGGLTGTAADLTAKINAQSALDIVATNPSTGKVVLTQATQGSAGNTTITTNSSSHWNTVCAVNVPSAFTGGSTRIAVTEIAENGGGAAGTAIDLAAKINAQSALDIVATVPSTGRVVLTQGTFGTGGNTTITTNSSSHWNTVCSVNVPSAFTGGDGTALETIEDRLEGAVNGVSGFGVTATDDLSVSGKVTLTQDYCGTGGNTTITDSATFVTVVSFTGGA